MIIGRLVSNNPAKAPSVDLVSDMKEFTLGRNAACTIKLDDNRCSSNHCRVLLENVSNEWSIKIEDLSTNGTYLNGAKIGKGNTLPARWGSTLDILKTPQVDENSKIGYTIEEAKRKNTISEPEKKQKADDSNAIDDKLADTLKCQICMEIMHQPISLYPCLHNFCGGCFSDWNKRANDCPSCRGTVTGVKKNHMVFSLIDMYLKKVPSAKRPQEELDELDKMNNFKQDRDVLPKAKKAFESDGSASESEETPVPNRGRGRVGRVGGIGRGNGLIKPAPQAICKQCTKNIEGFKCAPGQQHIQCFNCKNFMPDRNARQKCAICLRGFCNLYFKVTKCRVGIQTIDSYLNTVFALIPPNSLSENKYEQNVLQDYIRRKKLTMNVVANEMLDSMEVNKWNIDLSNLHLVGNSVQLTKLDLICADCAAALWGLLLYKYREAIENDLESHVKSRPKCWYGKDCTTQKHKLNHAQKLNHICEAVTST